jgi:hypothetical protein
MPYRIPNCHYQYRDPEQIYDWQPAVKQAG